MNNYSLERRIAKLERILYNEAKQIGTLYHVCTLDAYLNYILPTDTLKASGNYKNHLYNSNNYISFTRDKRFVVTTYKTTSADILIQLVIDGDKLSENYKITPYNDFAYSYDYMNKDNPKNREKEEVVKGPIKNISKYIKQVNIIFSIGYNIEHCERLLNVLEPHRKELSDVTYINIGQSPIKINNGANIDEIINIIKASLSEYQLLSNKLKTIRDAIKAGVDVNGTNIGFSPIATQCKAPNSSLSIIKLLLKSGADPNGKDDYGIPAIVLASKYGKVDYVEALINANADINIKSKFGTALQCAIDRNDNNGNEIAEILRENGANE